MASNTHKRQKTSHTKVFSPVFSPVFLPVIDKIKEINAKIEKITIEIPTLVAARNKQTTTECKYGSKCYQTNYDHLSSFSHQDKYLSSIKVNIAMFKDDIDTLLELIYDVYNRGVEEERKQNKNLFDNDWGVVAKEYLKGAIFEYIDPIANTRRFFPENTIYFYLLATLHNNMPTYAARGDDAYRQFLIILLTRMEEMGDATGLYQMTPSEYNALFTPFYFSNDGEKIIGVNKEPNGFVSLSNTSLLAGLQILRDKLLREKSLVGGRKRKSIRRTRRRATRRATVRRAKRCK